MASSPNPTSAPTDWTREPLDPLAENPWRIALEATGAGVWDWDLRTGVQNHSRRWEEMLGYGDDDFAGGYQEFMSLVHPDDAPALQAAVGACLDGSSPGFHTDVRLRRKDGSWAWIASRATVVEHGSDGRALRLIGSHIDVSEHKEAQIQAKDTENRWRLALESTGDGVWDWHIQTGVEYFSRRLLEIYGFKEGEFANMADELDRRTHPDDLAQMARDRQAHFDGLTDTYANEHRVQCKDGSWKWVLSRGMLISRDAQGRPARMIGTHTDITDRKASEVLIWQQAFFDTLTGLPNRRMFRDRLEQEIKRCKRDAQQLAILFIDLDHFKEVNDTLGHDNGDLLLVEAGPLIQACLRE